MMSSKKINFVVFLMFFFNIVGAISLFNADLYKIVLPLTQFNLLLIFSLFFYVNNNYSRSFIFLCLQVFLFGFIV